MFLNNFKVCCSRSRMRRAECLMLFGVKLFHYINNNHGLKFRSPKLICEKQASSSPNDHRQALSPKLSSFFLTDGYTVHQCMNPLHDGKNLYATPGKYAPIHNDCTIHLYVTIELNSCWWKPPLFEVLRGMSSGGIERGRGARSPPHATPSVLLWHRIPSASSHEVCRGPHVWSLRVGEYVKMNPGLRGQL